MEIRWGFTKVMKDSVLLILRIPSPVYSHIGVNRKGTVLESMHLWMKCLSMRYVDTSILRSIAPRFEELKLSRMLVK